MKIQAKIQKWGNGLALRVSGVMRDLPHFTEGSVVDVEVTEEGFWVKKSVSEKVKILPFSEAELLQGLTPELAHADILAIPYGRELEE